MDSELPDHYATLGVDPSCTDGEIRTAYRAQAKQHHPDVNQGSPEAVRRIQALNAAYETLRDPQRRRDYDAKRGAPAASARPTRGSRAPAPIKKDVAVRLVDLFSGVRLQVHVDDPSHPGGGEAYALDVPPNTAPGTRFRIPRHAPYERGVVIVRVKARPEARFKARGSDLRCDLRIRLDKARNGGPEMLRGVDGRPVRVVIPRNVEPRAVLRIAGEGLPKARGGRGDLLVRILYTPSVSIRRAYDGRES